MSAGAAGRRAPRPGPRRRARRRADRHRAPADPRPRAELDLELEDRLAAERREDARDAIVLGGRRRPAAATTAGFPAMVALLEAEAERIGPYRAGAATAAARALDERSARDWIEANVPGGSSSLLGRAVATELTGSFGLDPKDLSAITLSRPTPVPTRARRSASTSAAATTRSRASSRPLPERALRVGSAMQGLRSRPRALRDAHGPLPQARQGGRHRARPATAGVARGRPLWRPLPAAYRRMIAGLGMGTNAKLLLGLQRRPPPSATGRATCSPTSRRCRPGTARSPSAPQVRQGLLTLFTGGAAALALPGTAAHGPRAARPGARRARRARARGAGHRRRADRPRVARRLAPRPLVRRLVRRVPAGQVTDFWGLLQRPAGRIVFAGEHTSTRAQGYLEGAVESGERAARQVAALLRRGG